MKQKY